MMASWRRATSPSPQAMHHVLTDPASDLMIPALAVLHIILRTWAMRHANVRVFRIGSSSSRSD
jgi:hypothetical protein